MLDMYFLDLDQKLTCLQMYIFPLHSPRLMQISIIVYFSMGLLLNICGFPVLAISKAERAITVTPLPPCLYKNSLGQFRMGCFSDAFKENKHAHKKRR